MKPPCSTFWLEEIGFLIQRSKNGGDAMSFQSLCGTSAKKIRRGMNFLRKVVPPARFQRATFRLGVGFTSLLLSRVRIKPNENA